MKKSSKDAFGYLTFFDFTALLHVLTVEFGQFGAMLNILELTRYVTGRNTLS